MSKQIHISSSKFIALITISVLSTILATTLIIQAMTPPSSTFVITAGGIYPGAPSYTVWTENGEYYIKDIHGELHSSSNGSELINTYAASNTTILVEPGNYTFGKLDFTNLDGFAFVGSGRFNTYIWPDKNMNEFIDVSNATDIRLQHFTVNCTNFYVNYVINVATDQSAQRLMIDNVEIINGYVYAIHNGGGEGTWITNCWLIGNGNATSGGAIDADGGRWFISDNSISYGGIGITCFAGGEAYIVNNDIALTYSIGIYVTGMPSMIANNKVSYTQDIGIWVYTNGNKTIIDGNYVYWTEFDGIKVQDASSCVVSNNLVDNANDNQSGYSGIALYRADKTSVSGNTVVCVNASFQRYGIYIDGDSDFNTIVGNTCYGNFWGIELTTVSYNLSPSTANGNYTQY